MTDEYANIKNQLKTISKSYQGDMLRTLNEARLAIMDLQEELDVTKKVADLAVDALADISTYDPELVLDIHHSVKQLANTTLKEINKIKEME